MQRFVSLIVAITIVFWLQGSMLINLAASEIQFPIVFTSDSDSRNLASQSAKILKCSINVIIMVTAAS